MSQNDPLENATVLEAPPQRQTIDLMGELSAPTPTKPATATTPHERPFDPAFLAEFGQAVPQLEPAPARSTTPEQPAAPPDLSDPDTAIDLVAQAVSAAGGMTPEELQTLVYTARTEANVKAFLRDHKQDYHQCPENDGLMNRFLVENHLAPSVENLELAMETLGDMLVSPEISRYQQPPLPPLPKPRSAQPERKPVQTGLPDSRTPAPPPDQIAELMKVVQDPSVSRDVAEDAMRRAMRLRAQQMGQREY